MKLDVSEYKGISELEYQANIEGLRGVAILFILACHYIGNSFSFLWIGVDLFFVLSGFLITRILLNTTSNNKYFINFYIRRALRIFPLYYFTLVIFILVIPRLFTTTNFEYLINDQLWFWLYSQNIIFARDGWPGESSFVLSHFWSLAIEEQFYIIWPLILYMFRHNALRLIYLILVLIFVAVACRMAIFNTDPSFYVLLPTRMDSLLIGSLCAVMAGVNRAVLVKCARFIIWPSVFCITIVFLFSENRSYSNDFFAGCGYTILAILFASVLVLSYKSNGLLNSFLRNRVFTYFGRYSYGIYVFHFPIYWLLRPTILNALNFIHADHLGKIVAAVALLMITLLISMLSYNFYEKPFLLLKSKFN